MLKYFVTIIVAIAIVVIIYGIYILIASFKTKNKSFLKKKASEYVKEKGMTIDEINYLLDALIYFRKKVKSKEFRKSLCYTLWDIETNNNRQSCCLIYNFLEWIGMSNRFWWKPNNKRIRLKWLSMQIRDLNKFLVNNY